jgi:hypothetical protein
MSQNDAILNHLKKQPLTSLDAIERFKCLRLAARIRDLRDRGHNIHSAMVERDGKRFARYSLLK